MTVPATARVHSPVWRVTFWRNPQGTTGSVEQRAETPVEGTRRVVKRRPQRLRLRRRTQAVRGLDHRTVNRVDAFEEGPVETRLVDGANLALIGELAAND